MVKLLTMDKYDLAWLAGIIDGEGSFGAYKNHAGIRYPRMTISQSGIVRPEMLYRIDKILPFTSNTTARLHPNPSHAIGHHWAIEGYERVQAVLAMVWNWLGTIKRMQAVEALQAYMSDRPNVATTNTERANKSWTTRRARGSHPNTFLSDQAVLLVRYLVTIRGIKQARLVEATGACAATISNIVTRKTRKYLT